MVGQGLTPALETVDIEDIKRKLINIRKYARDNISSLVEELKTNLSQKYPGIVVKPVSDNVEAIRYIAEISNGTNTISINNSSIVTQELKPGLIADGFTVINSYLDEFDIEERKILDYWDLPLWPDRDVTAAFEVSTKMAGIDQTSAGDRAIKKYLAVLGTNAVSVKDTTVFFLQHFSNVYKDLRQAEKVILVIGLDKIVKDRQDAIFQTKCMGMFGKENVLLNMQPKSSRTPSIAELPLPPSAMEKELHLIILDNGRSNLLKGKFRDLFLCIGCRACNKHCPVRHFFSIADPTWTPRNYLGQFLYRASNSVDTCLHCEACRMDCPLDIDLPRLMWQAKLDYISEYGRPFHQKILGIPEILAKLGTVFAPLSNWMMGIKPLRIFMEFITGIDRRTNLPIFYSHTFRKWYNKNAR